MAENAYVMRPHKYEISALLNTENVSSSYTLVRRFWKGGGVYKPFWNVRSHHWEGKDGRLPTKPMTLCCNDIYAKMLLFCLARRLLSLFLGFCWLKRKECIKMDESRLAALLMSWLQLGRWQEQLGISLDQPSGGCIVAKAFIKVPWLE